MAHDHDHDHHDHVHVHHEGEETCTDPTHHHHHHVTAPYVRQTPKLGRNDPCHCGSGKKFKKCHGS